MLRAYAFCVGSPTLTRLLRNEQVPGLVENLKPLARPPRGHDRDVVTRGVEVEAEVRRARRLVGELGRACRVRNLRVRHEEAAGGARRRRNPGPVPPERVGDAGAQVRERDVEIPPADLGLY